MAAGDKPVLRIVAKSKTSDNFAAIVAFWDNDGRLGGKLDADIECIVMKDGRRITNEIAWINCYDERTKPKPGAGAAATTTGRHAADATAGASPTDPPGRSQRNTKENMDDIPF
tara:strand:+ start:160 stop:501 length:342 start_codon:yes stop_codon:yes gene_type:complete